MLDHENQMFQLLLSKNEVWDFWRLLGIGDIFLLPSFWLFIEL
jgi:hypothetical protein